MKVKKRFALGTTTTLEMKVGRVPVRVLVDGNGRPLRVDPLGAGIWGDDPEREGLIALAATHAFDVVAQTKRKRDSENAWKKSADDRAEASAEHWANEWLAKAHAEHPEYRRARLARHARQLASLDPVAPVLDEKKRDDITEGLAQQFLDRLRKPGQTSRKRG